MVSIAVWVEKLYSELESVDFLYKKDKEIILTIALSMKPLLLNVVSHIEKLIVVI